MDIRKAFFICAGTIFVGLGVLGMILPLMPTTVFLLMAAYCYSRSSDRFHTWLLTNRWCGGYISNYRSGRGMTVRQKITSIGMLWLSMALSVWLVGPKLWLIILLLPIAAGVTYYLLRLNTYRPEKQESVTGSPAINN